ncbi:DDE-type integrase/transposase/recombinase [Amaricoccus sp.]|uniref:DDE-type integrase/transposase/recombinase n=1 Tax=Amaricoccus sp. TaxID=1872485 RepID=UPI0025C2D118|nr:DDE-type integrase/transposase/recombinase [Amaricoccus sp.]
MRENDLNPRTRRRFSRTTDSDHDGPIFPFVARSYEVHGPDQLWVGDITYVAIASGFVYLTVILDAWSRRVVGHALARDLEARHSVAALARAIALRRPPPGCVFHSDRGAQYASGAHRRLLAEHGFIGSMSLTLSSKRGALQIRVHFWPRLVVGEALFRAVASERRHRPLILGSKASVQRRLGREGRGVLTAP